MVEVLVLLLIIWPVLALVQSIQTHVPGQSIAISTLLLCLALYLHRLVQLMVLTVLVMKTGEKGMLSLKVPTFVVYLI